MKRVRAAVFRFPALSIAPGVPPDPPPRRCSVISLGWRRCVLPSGIRKAGTKGSPGASLTNRSRHSLLSRSLNSRRMIADLTESTARRTACPCSRIACAWLSAPSISARALLSEAMDSSTSDRRSRLERIVATNSAPCRRLLRRSPSLFVSAMRWRRSRVAASPTGSIAVTSGTPTFHQHSNPGCRLISSRLSSSMAAPHREVSTMSRTSIWGRSGADSIRLRVGTTHWCCD